MLVRLRVIASLGLVAIVSCAVILGAPGPAGATLQVSAFADFRDAEGVTVRSPACPRGATSCSVAVGSSSASASASFGSVDGAATTGAGLGAKGDANASALFSDQFVFLNGSGAPTLFVVQVDTTGAMVSGAVVSGDFAELQVLMTLQDTVTASNKAFAEFIL